MKQLVLSEITISDKAEKYSDVNTEGRRTGPIYLMTKRGMIYSGVFSHFVLRYIATKTVQHVTCSECYCTELCWKISGSGRTQALRAQSPNPRVCTCKLI